MQRGWASWSRVRRRFLQLLSVAGGALCSEVCVMFSTSNATWHSAAVRFACCTLFGNSFSVLTFGVTVCDHSRLIFKVSYHADIIQVLSLS